MKWLTILRLIVELWPIIEKILGMLNNEDKEIVAHAITDAVVRKDVT